MSTPYPPTNPSGPQQGGGYGAPPGYAPPPSGYAPPPSGYAPPPSGYAPPPAGYAPPPSGYTAVPTQYPPPGQQPYPGQFQNPNEQVSIIAQPQAYGAPSQQAQSQMHQPQVPRGLEYLSQLDQLLVKQKVEVLEMMTGFETQNKYKILNSMGQEVYKAKEKSGCCARQCCGPIRPFGMEITDNHGNEVIHLERPLACTSCFCPCWLQTMEVHSPPGTIIGTIEQDWSLCVPQFTIRDESGKAVLRIEGPFCTWSCFGDVDFEVQSVDSNTQVGKISKQWTGLVKEAFTDADNFGVSFPLDLDAKIKATLLGAVFLIDFMFFEKSDNKENDNPGMF